MSENSFGLKIFSIIAKPLNSFESVLKLLTHFPIKEINFLLKTQVIWSDSTIQSIFRINYKRVENYCFVEIVINFTKIISKIVELLTQAVL